MSIPRRPGRSRPGRNDDSSRGRHDAASTVFETERGRVARCACCGGLEIRFGNAVLALADDDELTTVLDALVASELPGRGALLRLGDTGCGWAFDAAEVAELHRLVAGARLMLDVSIRAS